MPVHKKDGTAKPGVARVRASPVGVVVRDGAGVGGIVARVVDDPGFSGVAGVTHLSGSVVLIGMLPEAVM